MRRWLAHLLTPTTCDFKLHLVQSFRSPDRMVDGEIVPGDTYSQWQTCAQKKGHKGLCGGYARGYRLRLRLANWMDS